MILIYIFLFRAPNCSIIWLSPITYQFLLIVTYTLVIYAYLHTLTNLTKILFFPLSYFINVSSIHLYGWILYKQTIETNKI